MQQLLKYILSGLSITLLCMSSTVTLAQSDSDTAETGDVLYRNHCAKCHGADGSGTQFLREIMGLNVVDLKSIDTAIQLSQIDLKALIQKGRPTMGMPAFENLLTPEQLDRVLAHLTTKIMPHDDDIESLYRGQKIFRRHCSVCHGDRGQVAIWARAGLNPQPADFSDETLKKELTRQRMTFSVSNGRPDTAMTSWLGRFSEDQINDTVSYIRVALMGVTRYDKELGYAQGKGAPSDDPFMSSKSFTEEDVAKVAPVETDSPEIKTNDPFLENPKYSEVDTAQGKQDDIYDPFNAEHDHEAHMGSGDLNSPLPGGMMGDREHGKQLYEDNCAACHGSKGDGKGDRAYFIFPKPRNFHHPAVLKKFTRSHIFTQVSKGISGTVMPAWKQVLDNQSIADVSEYLFVDIIHKGTPPGTEQKTDSSASDN